MVDFFKQFNNTEWKKYKSEWVDSGNFIEENFELWFILRRVAYFCDILSSCLTNKLNDCGWMFRRGDDNHHTYQQYQKYEEYRRLTSTLASDIYKKPQKQLEIDELEEIYNMVRFFNSFFELFRGTYQFLNSELELKKLIKNINKMENYCYKAIRKRDII